MKLQPSFLLLSLIFFVSCANGKKVDPIESEKISAYALDGSALFSPAAPLELMQKLEEKKQLFEADSNEIMNVIWYARFMAYSGDYNKAIDLYSNGIKRFPDDARLYRHRGHRYITIRKFKEAIDDLKKASVLIAGKENAMEPDGMPNALNIPVSSTHGNIWYHLGLAYYLNHDFADALSAYQKCLATSTAPDNVVSATHWIYMILHRLGRSEEARDYLNSPSIKMTVIENQAYQDLCLFYKGEKTEEELLDAEGAPQSIDAILYGLGNFHFYNGRKEKAMEIWSKILQNPSWNSFAYIAAESEMHHLND